MRQCLICGADHERAGELCPRCQDDTAEEYDRMTGNRRAPRGVQPSSSGSLELTDEPETNHDVL